MRTVTMRTGHYFAGLNRPLLVPRGMVESAVKAALQTESAGRGTPTLSDFIWHTRDEGVWPPTNPQIDPSYSDDWNEWVEFTYQASKQGQALSFTIPDSIAWLVAQPGVKQPFEQEPAAPPPAPAPQNPPQYPPTWAQPGSVPVPPLAPVSWPNLGPFLFLLWILKQEKKQRRSRA